LKIYLMTGYVRYAEHQNLSLANRSETSFEKTTN
jgi:hypothetical protein